MSEERPSLEGQRQGKLQVTQDTGKKWCVAICDCGKSCPVRRDVWKKGKYNSCGCINPNSSHGQSGTRLYHIWDNMVARCHRPNSTFYKNYGGREVNPVRVCEDWRDAATFFKWALEVAGYDDNPGRLQSERLEIDRIDNEKGYSSDNCRFVTHAENQRNKRKLSKQYLRELHAEARGSFQGNGETPGLAQGPSISLPVSKSLGDLSDNPDESRDERDLEQDIPF